MCSVNVSCDDAAMTLRFFIALCCGDRFSDSSSCFIANVCVPVPVTTRKSNLANSLSFLSPFSLTQASKAPRR